MRRITSFAAVLMFAASCVATSATSEEEKKWDKWDAGSLGSAQRAYAAGKFSSALRSSSKALVSSSESERREAAELQLLILRALDRQAEADAFESFTTYYAPVENDGEAEPRESDDDWDRSFEVACRALWKDLPHSKHLLRKWTAPGGGDDPTPAERGRTLQATFAIGAAGKVESIQVVAASTLGEAWAVIDSVGSATVYKGRLSKLDPTELPIDYCVFANAVKRRGGSAGVPDFNIRGKGPGSL